MSKLIINKHQICYIPEYNCRNKTRDPHYGNHGCADNGEQDAYKIICYRIYLEPIEWK